MYTVIAYTSFNTEHVFVVDSLDLAHEFAARITRQGLWLVNADKTQTFYPVHQVFKVKIVPTQETKKK